MRSSLPLLLFLFPLVSTSGFLELTLRSPWKHETAIGVHQASAIPSIRSVSLAANNATTIRFPVDFNQTVQIVITVGGSPDFGLENSRFETVLIPVKGSLTPEMVPAPFDGFKVTFGCNKDFHGDLCLRQCRDDVAEQYGKRCNSAGFVACPYGYMGQNCTERIQMADCPCQNMGRCSNSLISYSEEAPFCECANGFYGEFCELQRDVQTVKIVSSYNAELRFVPLIIEKHYKQLAVKNQLDKKRVMIQMGKGKGRGARRL